jgi:hypothetical protein
VYALAAALCEKVGEPFPDRRDDASDLIERIRREIGHPEPALSPRGSDRVSRRRRGRTSWSSRREGATDRADDSTYA